MASDSRELEPKLFAQDAQRHQADRDDGGLCDLRLGERTRRIFHEAGLTTIEDVASLAPERAVEIPHLAPASLSELRAAILFAADVGPGAHVVEAGSGSGALSVVLASAVSREGRVVSYDVREEFLETARSNAARAGLAARIEFRTGDVRLGINEVDLDAVVLDIPDPWAAVQAAWDALRPCGHLACFSPNMEQVKETVAAIRARPFVDVYTIELIERHMEVRDVGVRPSFAPLGHTGYLTFARKVLEGF